MTISHNEYIEININKDMPELENQTSNNTKESLGYASGYSDFNRKSGAHFADGKMDINKNDKVPNGTDAREIPMSVNPGKMLDSHSNKFRRVNGYGSLSSAFEDPTYLIFDINIDEDSPLLGYKGVITTFLNEYSGSIKEIEERIGYWEEFKDSLLKIFPTDSVNDDSGEKRHYIEKVSGLDVLLKPIINFPEDIISFSITEDISMTLQYLSELYNNLTYSYDTHRYLIPDNLLRFNMTITIRDIRNMKEGENTNDKISTFKYILHDCQFNFMNTKNFGTDISRSGFGAASPPMSAGGVISMAFKSYSKITDALLISNSKLIDFRERTSYNGVRSPFTTINESDYMTRDEIIQNGSNSGSDGKTYMSKDNIDSSNRSKTNIFNETSSRYLPNENKSDIVDFLDNQILGIKKSDDKSLSGSLIDFRGFKDTVKNEIKDVRNVLIEKIYEEVNQVVTAGQNWLGDNLGFTLGRVNVYYDNIPNKISNLSYMFDNFLDKSIDSVLVGGNNLDYTIRGGNVYDGEPRKPREPLKGDLHPDGKPNKKFPEGDLHPDGEYNQNPPYIEEGFDLGYGKPQEPREPLTGDLHPDGIYNQNPPYIEEGFDLGYVPGKYNQKYPEGDLNPDGQYNQKYPEGDLNPDGQYNQKYPEGDLNQVGKYNQKFPSGDVYNVTAKKLPPSIDLGNVYKKDDK